ncbi:hypothetical protein GCM10010168_77760 [Actinoplanes ianthinogenes]|uniref:Uncharacterized protein n=1 Tax=Actinoplanes ianthinogenes TaxID=122358 RepID=A0ABM7LKL5_9ACTN|nr:hypothetical protein [Actinoplanes ianthinogenes]BCJ39768.1 hypothetical protein Aiant_04250 [Actinoplanes ianthinogenes]GGR47504.1 hypothetical protein GCM10010168_77760 [Actinoplanes ianthinogenes]
MTLSNPPASLEDLLHDAALHDGPLARVVADQLTRLLVAVDEISYGTSIDVARAQGAARPDQEATMALGNALVHRLKGLFAGRREAAGPVPDQPPKVTHQVVPTVAEKPRATATVRPGAVERGRIDEGIQQVFQDFAESPQVRAVLGADPLPGRTPVQDWPAFHLGLLRLHRDQAEHWRAKLSRYLPVEFTRPVRGWTEVLADIEGKQVLIPASHDHPGTVAWRDAPPHDIVGTAFGERVQQHRRIAGIASQMLWLAREDRTAQYATQGGLVPAQRAYTEFQRDVREGLTAYRSAESGTDGRITVLRAAQLAEVLRSVLHQPVAAPGSWWADARAEAMTFVRDTGSAYAPQLKVKDLGIRTSYPELRGSREADPESDIRLPVTDPADSGRIFDCLRPALLEPSGIYRSGRVIYGGDLVDTRERRPSS